MKKVLLLLLVTLLLTTSVMANELDFNNYQGATLAEVIKISDGDTLIVSVNGMPIKIRFAFIDAPELRGQDYGSEAYYYVKDLCFNEPIYVVPTQMKLDSYNRVVALLFLFDTKQCLNQMLIDDGYAWVYEEYVSNEDTLASLKVSEGFARDNKNGLWVQDNPTSPWDFRAKNF